MAFVPLSGGALKRRYGEFFKPRTVPLDEKNVPPALRSLIPYAEIWGVKDDVERCLLAEGAPPAAKADLLGLIGEFNPHFDRWLAGPEADSRPLSAEYVAFSNMRMAFDYLSVLS